MFRIPYRATCQAGVDGREQREDERDPVICKGSGSETRRVYGSEIIVSLLYWRIRRGGLDQPDPAGQDLFTLFAILRQQHLFGLITEAFCCCRLGSNHWPNPEPILTTDKYKHFCSHPPAWGF